MDIDMDIDYDLGIQPTAEPAQINDAPANDSPMPAAYYEDLDVRPARHSQSVEQWPESLNLQGVDDFDPTDAVYYLVAIGCGQKIKQQRWVNDTSLNLQFYSAEDAALALQTLTDPEAGDAASIPPEVSRKAKPYDAKPHLSLFVRQANSGDQKERHAGYRSKYYQNNPDVRGGDRRGERGREREPGRRQPPRRDFLDYDDEPARRNMRSVSGDEQMRDGSDYETRRNRRNNNREPHGWSKAQDVDRYRPSSDSARESRFGRLRGRSASPAADDEGDGRYGFSEQGTTTHHQYGSRSRSRNNRRRRDPSGERWAHDRANYDREDAPSGRWAKDTSMHRYGDSFSSQSNHRRSDAFDESANSSKGSLLSRMTKDGRPIAPQQARSLASRITRDTEESSYGRLKNDDSEPAYTDFSAPAPKRGLASRITRDDDDDEIQIRGRAQDLEGINIRGSASRGGFSIRGVAGGA